VPERELPAAVAVLRSGCAEPHVAREVSRAEALVLRGSEPSYLAWLREAAELAAGRADSDDPWWRTRPASCATS
jgi:hypothetical protein